MDESIAASAEKLDLAAKALLGQPVEKAVTQEVEKALPEPEDDEALEKALADFEKAMPENLKAFAAKKRGMSAEKALEQAAPAVDADALVEKALAAFDARIGSRLVELEANVSAKLAVLEKGVQSTLAFEVEATKLLQSVKGDTEEVRHEVQAIADAPAARVTVEKAVEQPARPSFTSIEPYRDHLRKTLSDIPKRLELLARVERDGDLSRVPVEIQKAMGVAP